MNTDDIKRQLDNAYRGGNIAVYERMLADAKQKGFKIMRNDRGEHLVQSSGGNSYFYRPGADTNNQPHNQRSYNQNPNQRTYSQNPNQRGYNQNVNQQGYNNQNTTQQGYGNPNSNQRTYTNQRPVNNRQAAKPQPNGSSSGGWVAGLVGFLVIALIVGIFAGGAGKKDKKNDIKTNTNNSSVSDRNNTQNVTTESYTAQDITTEAYEMEAAPSDYETSTSGKAYYTYARLEDDVYNGLGRSYSDIMAYKGQTSDPTYVKMSDYGQIDPYCTYLGNNDHNAYLAFHASGDAYFGDNDYCYGAIGWLERVFDYDKTDGPCDARALADVLNAKNTYTISDTSGVVFVPSNLNSDGLYVIEADLDTAQGSKSCVIYVEADSDSYPLSGDTWVEVFMN